MRCFVGRKCFGAGAGVALLLSGGGHSAVEVGVKAGYAVSDQLSISAKASFNNNDFEGSSLEVDKEWIFGAGATFKF